MVLRREEQGRSVVGLRLPSKDDLVSTGEFSLRFAAIVDSERISVS